MTLNELETPALVLDASIMEANVARLRAQGLNTIVFSNSTNEHLPGPRAHSWDEVARLVVAEKAAWEARG